MINTAGEIVLSSPSSFYTTTMFVATGMKNSHIRHASTRTQIKSSIKGILHWFYTLRLNALTTGNATVLGADLWVTLLQLEDSSLEHGLSQPLLPWFWTGYLKFDCCKAPGFVKSIVLNVYNHYRRTGNYSLQCERRESVNQPRNC